MPWFLVCVVVLVFAILIGTIRDLKNRLDQQDKDIEWLEDSIYIHDRIFAQMDDGLQYLFDQQTKIKDHLSRMDIHVAGNDKSIEELEKMDESIRTLVAYWQRDIELIQKAFEEFEHSLRAEEDARRKREEKRRLIERDRTVRRAGVSHQKHVMGRRRYAVF